MMSVIYNILSNPKSEFDLLKESVERYKIETRKYYYAMSVSKELRDNIHSFYKDGYVVESNMCPKGFWDVIIQILY